MADFLRTSGISHSPFVNGSSPSPSCAAIDVVAIDGPSGAGKSTVAKRVAGQLGYQYLDTGAMYRAVTWHFPEAGCVPAECSGLPDRGAAQMRKVLDQTQLLLAAGRVLVNGLDVTSHLRTREVESQVSAVAALPFVRAAMRALQRQVAAAGALVAEGRDMCTAVFPNAAWKVFLDAKPLARAERRVADFARQGRTASLSVVLHEIEVRDRLDSTRDDAPLRQAQDAQFIDTSLLSSDQVVALVLALVRGKPRVMPS